jgi:hypothetical protein
MTKKLADSYSYPPRGIRRPRAAAYLDMSEPTFAKLVDEGKMPKPKKIRGMAICRQALDAAFDALSEDEPARRNTIDEILGIRQ